MEETKGRKGSGGRGSQTQAGGPGTGRREPGGQVRGDGRGCRRELALGGLMCDVLCLGERLMLRTVLPVFPGQGEWREGETEGCAVEGALRGSEIILEDGIEKKSSQRDRRWTPSRSTSYDANSTPP